MAKPDIDIDLIQNLAELLARTGLTEIEIEQDTTRIRVARQISTTVEVAAPVHAAPAQPAAQAAASEQAGGGAQDEHHPDAIKAPIVGTVYMSPEPSAPPFVRPGDSVEEGQTLLIIEAMKVMNAIRAPRKGKVIRIMVENEAPVEFGEPLLILE